MIHIIGPPLSLKTTLIEIGVWIYESIYQKKISPLIFDPNAYTNDELFGSSDLINDTSESVSNSIW